MTIWYFDERGKVVSRPVAMTSSPSCGLEGQPGKAGLPDHRIDRGVLVLEREIGMAGGMLAAKAGDFAAHPHMAELVLDGALDRLGDLGDGEFGGIGQGFGHVLWCDISASQVKGSRIYSAASASCGAASRLPIDCTMWLASAS